MADPLIAPQVICVTGAASGIGAALCRRLRLAGAYVIGIDRNPITGDVDEQILLDLADPGSILHAVTHLPPALDALCNCAGIPPCEDASRVFRVNFLGPRQLTHAALDRLRDGGVIVNIASMAALRFRADNERITAALGLPLNVTNPETMQFLAGNAIDQHASYAFSKQAIVVWTKQLQCHLADRRIRVNSVSPGPVETPILADFIAAFGEKAQRDLAVTGRAARSEEIAAVIQFLISPDAGWVRGIDLPVDGGLEATRTIATLLPDRID